VSEATRREDLTEEIILEFFGCARERRIMRHVIRPIRPIRHIRQCVPAGKGGYYVRMGWKVNSSRSVTIAIVMVVAIAIAGSVLFGGGQGRAGGLAQLAVALVQRALLLLV
jgi:hypothetical protein